MQLIHPSVEIITEINATEILKHLELVCRVCYKSEDKIKKGSAEKLIKMIMGRQHDSILEHFSITFKMTTERSVSHELVRHRMASYAQESQRYVNYNKKGLCFIIPDYSKNLSPCEVTGFENWPQNISDIEDIWLDATIQAEEYYNELIEQGLPPEQARDVLPNSTKTEVMITMNIREIRHFLKLRTAKPAHPKIRKLAVSLYSQLMEKGLGIVLEDINPYFG